MADITKYQQELMEHALGLDDKRPYRRHGKLFYKAYRKQYDATQDGKDQAAWEELISKGYATGGGSVYYVTQRGIDTLAAVLGIERITWV